MLSASLRRNLAQRLFKHFRRLPARNQMPLIDDNRRHRGNPLPLKKRFALAHFLFIRASGQHFSRFRRIESDLGRE